MSTTHLNGQPDTACDRMLDSWRRDLQVVHGNIKRDRETGEAALRRLLPIAHGHSGQCRSVAAVLLACYNGRRFPLNLTNLRSIDYAILDDVLAVLRMDANALQEVHCYFENGGQIFGCATIGSRLTLATATGDETTPSVVYVIDVLGVTPTAAP